MKLGDFIDIDANVFPEDEGSTVLLCLIDKISSFNIKYKIDVWEMDEIKISKLLHRLLNHISEAVFFIEPRNVLIEKKLTMKHIAITLKKHLIKSFDVEGHLLNKIDFLNKNNSEVFNKILLKHIRGIEHGFHSCGRRYDLRFRKKRNREGCLEKYSLSTMDSLTSKESLKTFDSSKYNIWLSIEIESIFWKKKKQKQ